MRAALGLTIALVAATVIALGWLIGLAFVELMDWISCQVAGCRE